MSAAPTISELSFAANVPALRAAKLNSAGGLGGGSPPSQLSFAANVPALRAAKLNSAGGLGGGSPPSQLRLTGAFRYASGPTHRKGGERAYGMADPKQNIGTEPAAGDGTE